MDQRRRCFQFIWKIKDFNFTFNRSWRFESPIFFVQVLDGTKWNLVLYNEYYPTSEEIVCRLQRQNNDFGPDPIELNYELSFVSADGTVIRSHLFLLKTYNKGNSRYMSAIDAYRAKVIMNEKNSISDDTLTIHCRMWPSANRILKPARCTVESQISTECRSIIGTIQQFHRLKTNTDNMICINSSPKEIISFMNLCLCIDDNGKLTFQMKPVDPVVKTYKFNAFILDTSEYKLKVSEGEICNSRLLRLPLNLSLEHLMENKERYLPHDVLTIQIEFVFPAGNTLQIINGNLYKYDFQETRAEIPTRSDSLISLFREGKLCDIKLKTATKTFLAHKVVLGGHSPVFASMLTADMREKTDNCVNIEDLDADTVLKMLLFMYSGTVDSLNYRSAKSLYFAADKYDIISLKQKCSHFLKEDLQCSNCCEVLLLSDIHEDKDLKRCVQDFMRKNEEEVLFSDQWKKFEDTHPRLTNEVFEEQKKNERSQEHIQ